MTALAVIGIIEQVLKIIALTMEMALRQVEQMPAANQQAFWERHERRMERLDEMLAWWQNALRRLQPQD
jgi:hypothetical protein